VSRGLAIWGKPQVRALRVVIKPLTCDNVDASLLTLVNAIRSLILFAFINEQ
jgi:hypothetical protein